MIDVSLTGTGGMMPLPNRFLSSLAVRVNGSILLIDCGEGTQVSLKQLGWGYKNIDFICFTHFHADHISGLPGLLLTIGNSDRTEPLTIVGPVGIANIVKSLCAIAPELPFPLDFIELRPEGRAPFDFELGKLKMSALPLDHRVSCIGYRLELPRAGKFDAERARSHNIPLPLWSRLQKGEIIERDGVVYTPYMVLGEARKGLSICYITDTRPTSAMPAFINGADLFICEGLYGSDDKLQKAKEHKHMLFSEAARLALDGGAAELWLTHYSPAMPDPWNYINAAKEIFANSKAGYDRMSKTLLFEDQRKQMSDISV